MRAGLLNEIITLYRPTITKNEFGEDIETWNTVGDYRARVVHAGGSRTNENSEMVYPYQKTFIVRIYVDIQEDDIIAFKSTRYRVLSIEKSRELQQITVSCIQIEE